MVAFRRGAPYVNLLLKSSRNSFILGEKEKTHK